MLLDSKLIYPLSSKIVCYYTINRLDFQRLNSISRRNKSFQRRLLQKVLAIAYQDRYQLLMELEHENWTGIEIAAHRLKGSSANVGAIAVHQVATELETGAQAQNYQKCQESLTLLKQKLEELDELIGQYYPPSD